MQLNISNLTLLTLLQMPGSRAEAHLSNGMILFMLFMLASNSLFNISLKRNNRVNYLILSNMPVGVLFDLHCLQGSAHPWRVTVHFRDFPVDKILKCNREASEKTYMHTLKQALFVLQGNTRAFNAMVTEQQQLLWEASNSGSRGLFDSIATELQGTENVKCVPVRILYKEKKNVGEGNLTVDACDSLNITKEGMIPKAHESMDMISCIQKPVRVLRNQSGGEETLLLDVLRQFLPTLFSNDSDLFDSLSVLIQGVDCPLRSPIMQLWKTCAHADFFLYIIISSK